MRLYHHKTDGGAEYLTDKCIDCPDESKEGVLEGATIIVRIDGDITRDAEISLGGVYDAARDLLAIANNVVSLAGFGANDYSISADERAAFVRLRDQARAAIAKAESNT
jgi:hypothetical protein